MKRSRPEGTPSPDDGEARYGMGCSIPWVEGVPGVEHIDLDELGRRIARLQRLPAPAQG